MAMSVAKLAQKLGKDPRIVKGAALALGIQLERIGPADRVTTEDAEKIRRALCPEVEPTAAAAS